MGVCTSRRARRAGLRSFVVRDGTTYAGAGISVSSPANIPDFRSASGLFTKLKERYPDAGLSSGKDLFDARLFNVGVQY